MDEYDDDEVPAFAEQLPTWWCGDVQVLRDLVAVTLGELTEVDLESLDADTWLLEAGEDRCMITVLDADRGVEVSAALAYDVPSTASAMATVLRFNQTGSPARHWLSDGHLLMTTARVSARPFVGAHLIEAIQIVFGASAEGHHAAAACGGVPARTARSGTGGDELQ